MKNNSKILLLVFVSLVVSSCFNKLKEKITPTPSGTASIVADGKTIDLGKPTAVTLLGVVTVEAIKDKNGFTLLLNKADIKTGKTYDLKSSTGVFSFLYDGAYYSPSKGTLEITNFTDNKIVEGKFSFDGSVVGISNKSISATGTFSINIIL